MVLRFYSLLHFCIINFVILNIADIVDKSDTAVLDKLHPYIKDESKLVRLSAYEAIGRVANKASLPYLKEVFKNEDPACKFSISELFGRIGSKVSLPLLEEYLKEIDQMDFSQEHKGGTRGSDPHPEFLKNGVEKAIASIRS